MDNLPPKEISDEKMINQAFHELLNDYLNTKHRKKVEIITKAFNFANQAHKGIKRRSGEPYIMHPIAVASIVCNEIGLGSTSIGGTGWWNCGCRHIPYSIIAGRSSLRMFRRVV